MENTLKKLRFFAIILVFITFFGLPHAQAEKEAIPDTKLFEIGNKSFIEIQPEAKITTLQNSPTRKSFYLENGSLALSRKVLNNIDTTKNTLLDCDILTCTWKTEITPAQTMRLKPEDISGGFQFGQATYSAPYFLREETYNETISGAAIWKYSNFTDANGTAQTVGTIVGYEKSTTETRTRIVKDYDISSLILEAGKTYTFYIDFRKNSPADRVDIYDSVLGVENKELAWWDSLWAYYIELTFNNTAGEKQNATLNITLNSSNFNYSHANTSGKDVRILNKNSSLLQHYSFWSYNSTSVIYFQVPVLQNGTSKFYFYYGNQHANGTDNETIFAHRFYSIKLHQILNMHGPRSDEYAWKNTTGGNISPTAINENPNDAFGFSLYNGISACADQGEYFDAVGQYHNVSFSNAQVFTSFTAHTSYAGARGGLFNISFSDDNSSWYFIRSFNYSTTSSCGDFISEWNRTALVVPITPPPSYTFSEEIGQTSIIPSILNSTNGTTFFTNYDLYGWANLSDSSNSTWNGTCIWYMNDTYHSNTTFTNAPSNSSGILTNVCNITAGVAKHQNWIVGMNATNGTSEITLANSTTIIILNSPPILNSLSTPAKALNNSLIISDAQGTDQDNDTQIKNYQFSNETDILQAYSENNTYLCTPSICMNGTNISVEAYITDGEENSSFMTNWTIITEQDAQAYLTPTPAYVTSTIEGFASFTASDNATELNWTLFINGTEFDSGTISGDLEPNTNYSAFNLSGVVKNSTLILQMNGTLNRVDFPIIQSINSTELNVSNTPPTISTVGVPATALNDSLITANSTGSDVDNDSIVPYYQWSNASGIVQAFSTNASFLCTPASCPADFNITVEAYMNDSENISSTLTNQTLILGATPIDSCMVLDQEEPPYVFLSNVYANGTAGACIQIALTNYTLDCGGFSIIGDNSTNTYGIYSAFNSTKIQNCNILNFSHGVYFNQSWNSSVLNTTINTTYSGGFGVYG